MMDYRLRNQRLNLQNRRMRLLSNILDDYQENMRIALRLIERDLDVSYSDSNRSLFDTMLSTPRTPTPTASSTTPRTPTPTASSTTPRTTTLPRNTYIYTQLYTPSSPSETGITSQQLENVTTVMNYDMSMNETRCPISLEFFEPGQCILKINECGHVFSENALREWFDRHSSCPLCRKSVIGDDGEDDQRPVQSSPSNPLHSIASNAVNQIFSGLLQDGRYEFSFDMNDLMSTYEQLISSTTRNNERNTQ